MSVSVNAEFEHPAEAVWNVIADFGGLARWHPLIVRCELHGEGVGSLRKVYFDDWWAEERLVACDPAARTLTYEVTASSRPENVGAVGKMGVADLGAGRSRIDWTSGLDEANPHAAEVNGKLAQYYLVRLGHLADALARQPGDTA